MCAWERLGAQPSKPEKLKQIRLEALFRKEMNDELLLQSQSKTVGVLQQHTTAKSMERTDVPPHTLLHTRNYRDIINQPRANQKLKGVKNVNDAAGEKLEVTVYGLLSTAWCLWNTSEGGDYRTATAGRCLGMVSAGR